MIQAFTSADVPTMLLMSLVVSGVMALAVLFVAQRHGSGYGFLWWGCALLLNTVSDGLFIAAAESDRTWLLVGGYATLSAAVAAALQAVLAFYAWPLNRAWLWLPPAMVAVLSFAFARDAVWGVLLVEPILVVQFALVAWTAVRSHHPGRPRRADRGSVIIATGMALAALSYVQRIAEAALGHAAAVDLATPSGWQTLSYIQGIACMVFATLGLVLMHREHAQDAARRANDKLVTLERERARLDERRRLLQDVHDGFGSQLATARLRVLDNDLDQQQMGELLGECLDDLYLVIDTLNNPDNSIETALIDYRHRMNKRLSRLPVGIEWRLDLDRCPRFDERAILQVLRIVQEALANALKHAHASHIVVEARGPADEAALRVVLADDGVGMPPDAVRGRGLDNMRSRARSINAELRWEGNAPGTRVVLDVPAGH